MTIALIGNGFTGATFPLASHLHELGQEVDCYYIVKRGVASIESLDFGDKISYLASTVYDFPKSNQLYQYLSPDIDVRLVPVFNRKRRLERLGVGKVFPFLNRKIIQKFCHFLYQKKYDFINLIVHNPLELQIATFLKKNGIKFCVTFHEVLNNLIDAQDLKPQVKMVLKYDVPIVVHSQKTKDDLIRLSGERNLDKRIYLIHFGPFESYKQYGKGSNPVSFNNYLLYLGRITPYKGLKYLYEAVDMLDDIPNIKVVVAGSGHDEVLKRIKNDERFIVLNRFIENNELVGLIRESRAVICPYIAASQSGLVQTAMPFGKPIIATKVGAFTEIIKDGENGYLAEPADSLSLANAIRKLYNGKETGYEARIPECYNWNHIATEYIQLFEQYSRI